jgi:hypothetical protein
LEQQCLGRTEGRTARQKDGAERDNENLESPDKHRGSLSGSQHRSITHRDSIVGMVGTSRAVGVLVFGL